MSGYTPGSAPASRCPHVLVIGNMDKEEIIRIKERPPACKLCAHQGPNLWLCLHENCLDIGCGETGQDHSTKHAHGNFRHSLTLNLTSLRVWCYSCQAEVFLENNDPPLLKAPPSVPGFDDALDDAPSAAQMAANSAGQTYSFRNNNGAAHGGPLPGGRGSTPNLSPTHSLQTLGGSSGGVEDSDSDDDDHAQPRGLTGLQNLGNTCYMNSALQALSNCPPLSQFFLDCDAFAMTEVKPMLAKSYKKLLEEMWSKRRPSYVSPNAVANGIKNVHPMFRGYTQQDTQEFLRCFMDQIHEELKVPVFETSPSNDGAGTPNGGGGGGGGGGGIPPREDAASSSSLSEIEYETCDSGLSSEKSKGVASSPEYEGALALPHDDDDDDDEDANEDGASKPLVNGHNGECGDHVGDGRLGNSQTCLVKETKHQMNGNGVNDDGEDDDVEVDEQAPPRRSRSSSHNNQPVVNCAPNGLRKRQVSVGGSSSQASGKRSSESEKNKSSGCKTLPKPHGVNSQSKLASPAPIDYSSSSKQHWKAPKVLQYRSVISDVFDGRISSSVQCLTCDRVSTTMENFQDLSLPIPSRDHLSAIHHSASVAAAAVASASSSSSQQGSSSGVGSGSSSSASNVSQSLAASKAASCGDLYYNPSQGWIPWMVTWFKSWFWGPVITLHDCLQAFFSADELKGDNMYSCERCKKLRNGIKYSRVLKLPEVLCIHLKRFRHEFMFSTKISSYVSFPLEGLDMRPYIHPDSPDANAIYDLIGVICHHGTAGGGHYTSYAQNPISGQWYEYDDMYVTEVELQQVENCEPYVLFYRKQQRQMPTIRARAVELMQVKEKSLMQFIVSKQWINKFNTFAEPGSITNDDFLCVHGGVPPHMLQRVDDMVLTVSQPVWEYLLSQFGGGPAVNRLYACVTCQTNAEKLIARQKMELDTFVRLNQMFQAEESPRVIYAISMSWFKQWEAFVRNREKYPPGPIDNSKIASTRLLLHAHGSTPPTHAVKTGSDYGQLSDEMFYFLHEIYGGSPIVLVHPTSLEVDEEASGAHSELC